MKCGTAATRSFLQGHPDLIAAHDEAYFFNSDKNYDRGLDWYFSLFEQPKRPGQITYEKSPTYYKSISAVPRVKA